MKKTLLAVSILAAVALAGCNATAPITPAQLQTAMHNTAMLVAAGCTVVQPTLAATSTATANPVAGVATGVNGVFCAANEAAAAAPVGASAASAPASASAPAASQ